MRTCLFSTLFLEGHDPTNSLRYDRAVKWLKYYMQPEVKEALGYDRMILTDNGSARELQERLVNDIPMQLVRGYSVGEAARECNDYSVLCVELPRMERYNDGRTNDYPYVWRGLFSMQELTPLYDKILRFDNDAYVLTKKCADFFRNLQSGWVALNQAKHADYPEDALSAICADSYHLLNDVCSKPIRALTCEWFERYIPWTETNKALVGDRYGNSKKPIQQQNYMDYYSQCPVAVPMTFRS